jgi:hypothetical protein
MHIPSDAARAWRDMGSYRGGLRLVASFDMKLLGPAAMVNKKFRSWCVCI